MPTQTQQLHLLKSPQYVLPEDNEEGRTQQAPQEAGYILRTDVFLGRVTQDDLVEGIREAFKDPKVAEPVKELYDHPHELTSPPVFRKALSDHMVQVCQFIYPHLAFHRNGKRLLLELVSNPDFAKAMINSFKGTFTSVIRYATLARQQLEPNDPLKDHYFTMATLGFMPTVGHILRMMYRCTDDEYVRSVVDVFNHPRGAFGVHGREPVAQLERTFITALQSRQPHDTIQRELIDAPLRGVKEAKERWMRENSSE